MCHKRHKSNTHHTHQKHNNSRSRHWKRQKKRQSSCRRIRQVDFDVFRGRPIVEFRLSIKATFISDYFNQGSLTEGESSVQLTSSLS
jgi:hypothetical protein